MSESKDSSSTDGAKVQSFAKRDFLRKIEVEVQAEWEQAKIFESDASSTGQEKYMGTFPYPYMNGRLHLGHTFTITKTEFAIGYQRLKGKNVLFPFGFHCTGMPIKACADKLKREMEDYGTPPVFPVDDEKKEVVKEAAADPTVFRAKKSKVQAKTENKRQWQIMQSLSIPDEEIPKFADAQYWLQYFPPHCQADLKKMGLGVDWRRSLITTDVNPYYDSFVRWQFETLKDRGKIEFGKRPTIYSPKDGQPCADHDRASGEGVLPQEYTVIKLELVQPFPAKLKFLEGTKKTFLGAATLRPETMYGQTNCWLLPEGDYGAFEINDEEVLICTHRAALNLSYQTHSKVVGKPNCLVELKGSDILGAGVKAPLAKYPVVYALPMLTVSPKKGTGIVTSVPSDAPDDYINLEELKRKQPFREKFGIQDHMIMPFDVVPIIEIPEIGNTAAATICQQLKIKSPNDRVLLDAAKEQCYTKGFYDGKMIVGECKDMSVQNAKPILRQKLIDSGEALVYSEPAAVVMSRSGDECVVCLTDQWFLNYGEENWRKEVESHLKSMDLFSDDTRRQFELALGWLKHWACSRTYGLGTRIPWDTQFLVESLSDSTIYMAYYTISHLLQGGVFDGSQLGPSQIKPEQLQRNVWDHIFLDAPYPEGCGIPQETLETLKKEFNYWYPLDLRVSGKDLIPNHLVFSLYTHVAIWPQSKAPRAFRANGHILLNGEKMSKSAGNFLTLTEAVDTFSADGMRFGLADAGDGLDDANFTTLSADAAVLRLYTQAKWAEEMIASKELREGEPTLFYDQVFSSEINLAIRGADVAYDRTNFREALRTGFFELQNARDKYAVAVGTEKMNKQLVVRFIEVQALLIAPITPHWSQFIWKLIGKEGFIQKALWPVQGKIDDSILKQDVYLQESLHSFRLRRDTFMKPKKGSPPPPAPTKAMINLAKSFPDWMEKTLTMLAPVFAAATSANPPDNKDLVKVLSAEPLLKSKMKQVMPTVASIKEDWTKKGMSALDLTLGFDEKQVLEEHAELVKQATGISQLEVAYVEGPTNPGKPFIIFS